MCRFAGLQGVAYAATDEECHEQHRKDETPVGTGFGRCLVAAYAAVEEEEQQCYRQRACPCEPVVYGEMRHEGAHLAADAEVGEYLVGEQAVGVLVVGAVAAAGYHHEQYGGDVQHLGHDAVPAPVACRQRQYHEREVGEEEGGHRGHPEAHIAEDQSFPLAVVQMEDVQVAQVKRQLRGGKCAEGKQRFL